MNNDCPTDCRLELRYVVHVADSLAMCVNGGVTAAFINLWEAKAFCDSHACMGSWGPAGSVIDMVTGDQVWPEPQAWWPSEQRKKREREEREQASREPEPRRET